MDWLWVLIIALRPLEANDEVRWASVLGAIDDVRAEAFAAGDPALLDGVYAPGSPARKVDAAAIRAYTGRGGRVTGADLALLSCRVVGSSTDRAVLDVVDRLGPATVVWDDGTSRALPRDRPTQRIVTLVRTEVGWRIDG